jgi:hypothetical protein
MVSLNDDEGAGLIMIASDKKMFDFSFIKS